MLQRLYGRVQGSIAQKQVRAVKVALSVKLCPDLANFAHAISFAFLRVIVPGELKNLHFRSKAVGFASGAQSAYLIEYQGAAWLLADRFFAARLPGLQEGSLYRLPSLEARQILCALPWLCALIPFHQLRFFRFQTDIVIASCLFSFISDRQTRFAGI